ncbi:MAG: hypothetical protein NXI25_10910 [bacterium]|nr:hypothetical protein [bacterium]
MKNLFHYSSLLLVTVIFLMTLSNCEKDGDPIAPAGNTPILTTIEATEVTATTAKAGGNITDDGGSPVTQRGVCWGTTQPPTLDEYKTQDGIGAGSYTSSLTNLAPNTTYYFRSYATNIVGTSYGSTLSFTTPEESSTGSFTDPRDGHVYPTVTIGDQVWMAENLAYLPMVNRAADGSEDEEGPYYYVYGYNGTNVNEAKATPNYTSYGVLYNWTAAMDGAISSSMNPSEVQGACPTGWHLPSDEEWTELVDYLGGYAVAGGKLKEMGNAHWIGDNSTATNETGFTARPGGYRSIGGEFRNVGEIGWWWSATEKYSYSAYRIDIQYGNAAHQGDHLKTLGNSVRCVRD